MCLILFAYHQHPAYPLILASNRDEFLDRPTARIHRWNQAPIHAGKDLKAGGTWMGVSSSSKWAALTNYREGLQEKKQAPSRGALVVDYLLNEQTPDLYARKVQERANLYNGYNLLLGYKEEIYYQSNRSDQAQQLKPGIYGLSNHLLNTSWPKVDKGKAALEEVIQKKELDKEALFHLLIDKNLAADEILPDTGIPYEWEKMLSAMFIESPNYGTRVSTILLMDRKGRMYVEERSYKPEGDSISFEIES
ncbi:MAG: NRDE family protein [Bacteroidia bacterium]|nr:NRDE family protein [Bacteroidia bacterium]